MPNPTFEQTMALAGLISFVGLVVIVYVIDLVQNIKHLKNLAPRKHHRELRREHLQRAE